MTIDLPKSTKILASSFLKSEKLMSLKLGNIVTIESYALSSTNNLKILDLTNCSTVPTITDKTFSESLPEHLSVFVKNDIYADIINNSKWNALSSHIYSIT
jgi:hypothetical protein